MDHSNIPVFKRPTKLPTREELAAIFTNKQPKLTSDSTPRILEHHQSDPQQQDKQDKQDPNSNPNPNPNPNPSTNRYRQQGDEIEEGNLNSIPSNIIPIVHEPNLVSDFFTDVTTDLSDPRLAYQINGILRKFPPPIPPPIPRPLPGHTNPHSVMGYNSYDSQLHSNEGSGNEEDDDGFDDQEEMEDYEGRFENIQGNRLNNKRGIMIPFIYPPPPVVNFDALPFSLASFKKRYECLHNLSTRTPTPAPATTALASAVGGNGTTTSTTTTTTSTSSGGAKRGRKPKNFNVNNESRGESPINNNNNNNINNSNNNRPRDPYDRGVNNVYIQAAPLPFPPPNYMKYPLNSDRANLVPHDVFTELLEANEELPRIDMVVASAAGSLFEMRQQANKEGFNILNFELEKSKKSKKKGKTTSGGSQSTDVSDNEAQESNDENMKAGVSEDGRGKKMKDLDYEEIDEEKSEQEDREVVEVFDSADEDDEEGQEGAGITKDETNDDEIYFLKIDTNEYNDFHAIKDADKNTFEINVIDPKFTNVKGRLSDIKRNNLDVKVNEEDNRDQHGEEIEDVYSYPSEAISNLYQINREEFFPSATKELAYASGTNRERRRIGLKKSVESMEEFERRHRLDIFQIKKYQLLKKIDDLKNSKIEFNKNLIYDQELKNINDELEITRDVQLVELKISENYELLKNSLNFYNNSNKIYKIINMVLINKLEKLKNFFEFQKKMFQEYIKNKQDIFDLNSKDSNKLMLGLSNKDYPYEIKEIFKNLIVQDLKQDPNNPTNNLSSIMVPELKFNEVDNNKTVLIHDFMPLITPEEFSIITGDLSHKALANNNSKSNKTTTKSHHNHSSNKRIIQSSIYEKMLTSGSDTNLSDSGTGNTTNTTPGPISSGSNLPKRRGSGRRANTGGGGAGGSSNGSSTPGGVGNNGIGTNRISDLFKEFDTVYSEASILAKIMKQFNGPQMAKPDELTHDLELMGIKTKWPVNK